MSTAPAKDQLFEPAIAPTVRDAAGTTLGESMRNDLELFAAEAGDGGHEGRRCNVGQKEQKVRLALGAGFVAAAIAAPVSRGWKIGLAAFGVSQIAMGAARFCPLWHALGVNTLDDRFHRRA